MRISDWSSDVCSSDLFFAIRLDQAQAAVDKLPRVDQAEVRKHWPDVVEVRIVEHRPFARWGDDQLLSEDGDLFPVADAEVPARLPRFDVAAPSARTAGVVELYHPASRIRTEARRRGKDCCITVGTG